MAGDDDKPLGDGDHFPTSTPPGQPSLLNPLPVKFVQDAPIFFVDGVLSQTFTKGVTKFYLYRVDPDPNAKGPGNTVPAVQIVMPSEQFAHLVTFFEHRLSIMVKTGIVSQEFVDSARASWTETVPETKAQN